jgi:hypothetical protein
MSGCFRCRRHTGSQLLAAPAAAFSAADTTAEEVAIMAAEAAIMAAEAAIMAAAEAAVTAAEAVTVIDNKRARQLAAKLLLPQ